MNIYLERGVLKMLKYSIINCSFDFVYLQNKTILVHIFLFFVIIIMQSDKLTFHGMFKN